MEEKSTMKCPNCNNTVYYPVIHENTGKKVKCRFCGIRILIPIEETVDVVNVLSESKE